MIASIHLELLNKIQLQNEISPKRVKGKISCFLALSITVSYFHITQETRTIHVDAMQLL